MKMNFTNNFQEGDYITRHFFKILALVAIGFVSVSFISSYEKKMGSEAKINGFYTIWPETKKLPGALTHITMMFRDAKSGKKVVPIVSANFNGVQYENSIELDLAGYYEYSGIEFYLPNGVMHLSMRLNGYEEMYVPINIVDQGELPYISNLTPLSNSFKDKRFNDFHLESLKKTNTTYIIGTIVDVDLGESLTSGTVSSLDGKFKTKIDATGYFELEIDKSATRFGNLESYQDVVKYVDLKFESSGYITEIIKNIPTWNPTQLQGQRMKKGEGINTTELEEIGTPHQTLDQIEPPSKLNQNLDSNKTSVEKYSADVLLSGGYPWNDCIPQAIVVGFANSLRAVCCSNCSYFELFSMNEYIKHVIPAEWLPGWKDSYKQSAEEAYKAGVVAIRSYCIYKIMFNPSKKDYYHICSSACCQAFGSNDYRTDPSVDALPYNVLTFNGVIANSEFSAQTNNKLSQCGSSTDPGCNCKINEFRKVSPTGGCSTAKNSCIYDPTSVVSGNSAKNIDGHGRGMSQWGSIRHASGYDVKHCGGTGLANAYPKKTWSQILSFYYPDFTQSNYFPCNFDCNAEVSVNCNSSFTSGNYGYNNNNNTYGINGNGPIGWNESGPERLYKLVITSKATISVSLSNISYAPNNGNTNRLDVFIISGNYCYALNPYNLKAYGTNGATLANAPSGTYFIVVDGRDKTAGTYKITINTNCLPNLTDYGNSFSYSGGRSIVLNMKDINNGTAPAGIFTHRYYFSTDQYYSSNDPILATINCPSLNPNWYTYGTYNVTIPNNIPKGTYYLFFYIDNGKSVTESNENDNIWYFTQPISIPSPLIGGGSDSQDSEFFTINVSEKVDIIKHNAKQAMPTDVSISTCDLLMKNDKIFGSGLEPYSTYTIFNTIGATISKGKVDDHGLINAEVNYSGVYFILINGIKGEKCIEKFFVK